MKVLLLSLSLILAAGGAWALEAGEALADPALEARAVALGQRLRCVECQAQSINDSLAPIAGDMRRLVRDRLAAGEDEMAITAYLRTRYGDYVLLDPPLQGNTYILWLAPWGILTFGGMILWRLRQPRKRQQADI